MAELVVGGDLAMFGVVVLIAAIERVGIEVETI